MEEYNTKNKYDSKASPIAGKLAELIGEGNLRKGGCIEIPSLGVLVKYNGEGEKVITYKDINNKYQE